MADKMMRISGRGTDGLAKAITTTTEGIINTQDTFEQKVIDSSILVEPKKPVLTSIFDSHGYMYGRIVAKFGGERFLKISIVDIDATGANESVRVIYAGWASGAVQADFKIISKKYQFRFEAEVATVALRADSYQLLFNQQSQVGDTFKRKLTPDGVLVSAGQSYTTDPLDNLGFLSSRLTVRLSGKRKLKISIIPIDHSNLDEEPQVIFDGEMTNGGSVNYETFSEKYRLRFEADATNAIALRKDTYEILNNFLEEKDPEVIKLIEKPSSRVKYPKGMLEFKSLPVNAQRLTIGSDGYYYAVDTNNVIKKYSNVIEPSEVLETGITWDTLTNGQLIYIFVSGDGVVYFSNLLSGGVRSARIYRSDTIQDTPVLVYQNQNSATVSPIWSIHFGVDHYFNGDTSIYLAGEYSNPDFVGHNVSRNLVLSTDGGRTFTKVKGTTTLDDSSVNSHWHDAHIDKHHGLLWASEGDGLNDGIHYSSDLGATWLRLTNESQPTAILSYPDKILFGRDDKFVGFDKLDFPVDYNDIRKMGLKTGRVFKNQNAWRYYAMKPVFYHGETYMGFHLYDEAKAPMIIASGDYGETWHVVWMGINQNEISNFVAIDESYVYAYKDSGVVYAEKPEWV